MASSTQKKTAKRHDDDDNLSKRVLDKDPDPPLQMGDVYRPPNTLCNGGGGSGDRVVHGGSNNSGGGNALGGVIDVGGASLLH